MTLSEYLAEHLDLPANLNQDQIFEIMLRIRVAPWMRDRIRKAYDEGRHFQITSSYNGTTYEIEGDISVSEIDPGTLMMRQNRPVLKSIQTDPAYPCLALNE